MQAVIFLCMLSDAAGAQDAQVANDECHHHQGRARLHGAAYLAHASDGIWEVVERTAAEGRVEVIIREGELFDFAAGEVYVGNAADDRVSHLAYRTAKGLLFQFQTAFTGLAHIDAKAVIFGILLPCSDFTNLIAHELTAIIL